jgi:predicted MFS family arabinose efflux permease
MAATNMGSLGVAALSPRIQRSFELSTTQIGLLLSVVFAAAALVSVHSGRLTDGFGARYAMAVSQLVAAAGIVIVASAPATPFLYAGTIVIGIGYGLLNPATNALASAGLPKRRRGLGMSIKQTGVTAGGAVAALVLPLLASWLGWRLALGLSALACAAAAAWALLPADGAARGASRPALEGAITPTRPILSTTRAYGLIMAGIQLALFAYLPVYLHQAKGLSETAAGVGYFIALSCGTLGRLLWGMVSDAASKRALPLAMIALGSAAGIVALLLADGPLLWPALALVGLCGAGWNGVYHAFVTESAPPGAIGHTSAIALFYVYAGSITGPPLLGLVSDDGAAWSQTWLVAASAATAIGTVLAVLAVHTARSRRPPTITNTPSSSTSIG